MGFGADVDGTDGTILHRKEPVRHLAAAVAQLPRGT